MWNGCARWSDLSKRIAICAFCIKNRCQNSGPLFCHILNIVKMHEWMLFICSKKCIYLKSETNIDEKSHKSC